MWSNKVELQYQDTNGKIINKFYGNIIQACNKELRLIP
jgi:hypothetical protein